MFIVNDEVQAADLLKLPELFYVIYGIILYGEILSAISFIICINFSDAFENT